MYGVSAPADNLFHLEWLKGKTRLTALDWIISFEGNDVEERRKYMDWYLGQAVGLSTQDLRSLRPRHQVRFFNILIQAGMNFTPKRYNFLRVDQNVWGDARELSIGCPVTSETKMAVSLIDRLNS